MLQRRWIEVAILLIVTFITISGIAQATIRPIGTAPLIEEARGIRLAASDFIKLADWASPAIINRIISSKPAVVFSLAKKEAVAAPAVVQAAVNYPAAANAPSIPVSASGSFVIQESNGQTVATFAAGRKAKVAYDNGIYYLYGPDGLIKASSSYFRAVPLEDSILSLPGFIDWNWDKTLNLNSFRGAMEVRYSPASGALWAINELPLEDYLKDVSEASADAPEEHLKVMAIVERSYAWYHLNAGNRHPGEPFTLKNSRNGNGDDQIYQGYLAEIRLPRLAAAAAATNGQVVTYQGQPVITPYSSNPGGRTRTPQEAGWNYNWPWVKSVADPDTAGMLRNGHGVGLSGYGSRKRAERGESASGILSYYFPGTAIGQVSTADKNIRIAIYSVK